MVSQKMIYNVGIYLRLSKDDGDNVESESITNQRKIIKDYIKENDDMILCEEYVDDGYSGANFNRPSFKKLIHDIETKRINMVITKNLARLGRNYIGVGNYIEKYFPDHGVRYLAILDNIDNFLESASNDFMPIKSVFNEKHCRDTSIAVKRTKRKRMEEGFYACTTPPFGYKKDPEVPGKLIIDEEASKTVKKIFELKLQGYTCNKIVEYLENNNYLTPSQYMNIRGLENVKNKEVWRKSSVTKILGNQVYLGYCVRGKTQKISYKSKDKISIKRKDFIVTKNTHEAIISEEVFETVHNTKKYGLTREAKENTHLLKNFIYCKNCGQKLIFKNARKKVYVYCRNNSDNPKLCSNDCKIDYNLIENKIIEYISNSYKEYLKNNKMKDNLYRKSTQNAMKSIENELDELRNILNKINFKIMSLYNQRLSDEITEEEYKDRYKTLLEERKELSENVTDKENEIKNKTTELNTLSQKKSVLKKIEKLEKKDFKDIKFEELIQRIEVFDKEINVKFNFSDIGMFHI